METQEVPKVIEAQEFVVRDKSGVMRAILSATSGNPNLLLNDRKGIPRISIELQDNDLPCIALMRQDGNPLLSFKQLPDGSTILGVSRNDKTPALLVITEDGKDVQVGLCRSDGEPVWLDIGDGEADGSESSGI
jgi:hypothetical protein